MLRQVQPVRLSEVVRRESAGVVCDGTSCVCVSSKVSREEERGEGEGRRTLLDHLSDENFGETADDGED
jgi:hypothetical protein